METVTAGTHKRLNNKLPIKVTLGTMNTLRMMSSVAEPRIALSGEISTSDHKIIPN